MLLLKNPYLDLIHQYIETDRCIIVPFSSDGRVNIREFGEEFCKANKNLWITASLPDYEEEVEFIKSMEQAIGNGERFDNFIISKNSGDFLGAIGLNVRESNCVNISLWIREGEQRKGYGSEAYSAILNWVREYVDCTFLEHTINMENEPAGRLALKFGGILQKKKIDRDHLTFYIPL